VGRGKGGNDLYEISMAILSTVVFMFGSFVIKVVYI
jgi:hypothetical protein